VRWVVCLRSSLGSSRLAVLILWIARPERVDAAFSSFLWPLLGITFLPFATLIYLLLYTPGRGLRGWAWFWVVLAALLDIGIGGPAPPSGTRSPAGAPHKHEALGGHRAAAQSSP
jgi:hypothetical protein